MRLFKPKKEREGRKRIFYGIEVREELREGL